MKMRNYFKPLVAVFAASLTLFFVPARNAAGQTATEAAAKAGADAGAEAGAVAGAKAGADAGAKAAAKAGDGDSWLGDSVKISGALTKLTTDPTKAKKVVAQGDCYMAPSNTKFDVTQELSNSEGPVLRLSSTNDITPATTGTVTKGSADLLGGSGPFGYVNPANWKSTTFDSASTDCPKFIAPRTSYYISQQELEGGVPYVRYGLTFGTLIVPFKYHLQSREFSSSPSVHMYMGYKRTVPGSSTGLFASLGIATADIPTGTGTATAKFGVSYAVGLILGVNKATGMQFMLAWGQDRFGENSGYQYERGTWLAASIGLGF